MITIKNQKTGETKQVDESQLSQYGIKSPNPALPSSASIMAKMPQTMSQTTPQQGLSTAPPTPGILPTIGGIGGMVAADVAGQPELSAPIAAAGGALGQMAEDWLSGKKVDVGNTLKQGAEQGMYALIPGEQGLGPGSRLAQRVAVGGAIGAGTQAVREIGAPGSATEKAKRIGTSALETGAAFPVVAGAVNSVAGLAKFLGERVPWDLLTKPIGAAMEKGAQLATQVGEQLVGHDNLQYARQNGIIPKTGGITSDVINTSLAKAKEKAGQVEEQLQSLLTGKVNFQDSGLAKIIQDIPNAFPGHQYNKAVSIMNDLLGKVGGTAAMLGRAFNPEVDLATVNEMKREVGKYFSSIPEMKGVYSNIRSLIEKASTVPDQVHALNEEAVKLMNIGENLLKNKMDQHIAEGLRPDAIMKSINDAKNGKFGSLNDLVNILSLGGLAGAHGISPSGGMGVTFGLRKTIADAINTYFQSEENRVGIASDLIKIYDKASAAEKVYLGTFLKALGIRAGGLPSVGGPATAKEPAGLKGPVK